jgi:hypothetical protein
MVTERDAQLVNRLSRDTQDGQLKWQPTAEAEQYTVSLKGKFTVTIDYSRSTDICWLVLRDIDGRELLKLTSTEYAPIAGLFEVVRRRVMKVDEAINEILGDS